MLHTHTFEGIGTVWNIEIQTPKEPKKLWGLLKDSVKEFESRFSRFKSDSLVNQFEHASVGTYKIDSEFALLLDFAQTLKKITGGKFNPAISQLISLTGYDKAYSFKSKEDKIKKHSVPDWQLDQNHLTINGPTSFDLGGFAKGYLIGKVAKLIESQNYKHYLVDAGGDMCGSTKSDNVPWQIAIENPFDNTQAIGIVKLDNTSLAVSDIFKRRWANRHHVIDPHTKISPLKIVSCAAIHPDPMICDGLTTCFMLSPKSLWPKLVEKFSCNYLVVTDDKKIIIDPKWPGSFNS